MGRPALRPLLGQAGRGAYVTVLDCLRRHSISLAGGALLATYLGKTWWYLDTIARFGRFKVPFLAFLADDLLFWSVAIAALLAVEIYGRRTWIKVATGLVALALALVALANVFWLRGTGGQLSVGVVRVGIERTAEIMPILGAALGTRGITLLALSVGLPLVLPLLFRAKWRKDGRGEDPRPATLGFPAFLILLALLGLWEQKASLSPGWRLISDNVHVGLAREYLTQPRLAPPPAAIPDPSPRDLGPTPPPERLPDVIVFVYEATAYRASLAPDAPDATPFLRELAASGLGADQMRTVLPHTTKSLFAALCGTYPAMQTRILETASDFPARCVPAILAERGYATALMQSADGQFEDRPRLARKLGFQTFAGFQDLVPPPEPLGYLGGDDMGLVEPVKAWIDAQEGPYFLTVLTSGTHHPYILPRWLQAKLSGDLSGPERYLNLVRVADEALRRIVTAAEEARAGRGRDLVVVAFGDHGESFGDHGAMQHDNVFTDEGLRVPFAIRAPGRVAAGTRVGEPRSLIDLAPTLLELTGVPYLADRFEGASVLRPAPRAVRRYFSCWYDDMCVGFVDGTRKTVAVPRIRSWMVLDLEKDPAEDDPLVEPDDAAGAAREALDWYNAHRYQDAGLRRDPLELGRWRCGKRCEWAK